MKKYMWGMLIGLLFNNAFAHDNDAKAGLYDQTGQRTGKVKFTQQADVVVVEVRVSNLSPGFHGFHLHTVGECIPPFTSAGGHFDLDAQTHRDHTGDLPVLLVNTDGTAKAKFRTDRFRIADLFDADGSAVIIHADPDNYANIPIRYVVAPDATTLATGDAGARIVCGIVE
jgi:superoxide dismutase, Cu-Zn family